MGPPDSYNDGTCNADLPNDSVYTRFLYTVRYMARNGFYVVLDNQVNVDSTIVDNPDVRPSPHGIDHVGHANRFVLAESGCVVYPRLWCQAVQAHTSQRVDPGRLC